MHINTILKLNYEKKVLKFGGTSVGSIDRIKHAAKSLKESDNGNKIIVVVSAGRKNNELIIIKGSSKFY